MEIIWSRIVGGFTALLMLVGVSSAPAPIPSSESPANGAPVESAIVQRAEESKAQDEYAKMVVHSELKSVALIEDKAAPTAQPIATNTSSQSHENTLAERFSSTDINAIRQMLAEKFGLGMANDQIVPHYQKHGFYSFGLIETFPDGSGSSIAVLARKNNDGSFSSLLTGQEPPECDRLAQLQVPPDVMSVCYDSEGRMIDRLHLSVAFHPNDAQKAAMDQWMLITEATTSHPYSLRENRITYNADAWPPPFLPESADVDSFSLLVDPSHSGTYPYAKDERAVYCDAGILAEADVDTFSLVYAKYSRISGAYSTRYAKDRNHVYHNCKIVMGADPGTFKTPEE